MILVTRIFHLAMQSSKGMFDLENKWDKLDYNLLFILFLLLCISIVTIYTGEHQGLIKHSYLIKQLMWYFLCIPILAVVTIFDLDIFNRISLYIYILGLLLLAGILVAPHSIAPDINGAKGWYTVGSFSFQPSDIMKIGIILMLSHTISKANEDSVIKSKRDDIILLLKMIMYVAPALLLVFLFPDMGSILSYLFIFIMILLVSGIRWSIIGAIFSFPAAVIAFLVFTYFYFPSFFLHKVLGSLPAYQASRFEGWLWPSQYADSAYQLNQSMQTIGAGQLFGLHHLGYIPFAYSDFIFSIIAGKYGFIGASVVISIFFVLIYRIVVITINHKNSFGSYIGAGVVGMISFQVFQNIGMSIGLLPITGLGLPFISYGGSSLVAYMTAIGLILNMKMNTKEYMFDQRD